MYMMRNAILGFAKQFAFDPRLEQGPVPFHRNIVVAGMGGSHLAADILANLVPERSIRVWSDYELPYIKRFSFPKTLLVASSYSGNTEETISAYETAHMKGMPCAVIAVGGKLIELAKRDRAPYVQLPDTGIQPRSALGYSLRGLIALLSVQELVGEATYLSQYLDPAALEPEGQKVAEALRGRIPVVYASTANACVAYNWKIKLNETGKTPAFCNIIPELNHNEMTGFDAQGANKNLSEKFAFVFLRDSQDYPRNKRRMDVTAKLYRDRGFPVVELELDGVNRMERIFRSLVVADWTAVALADHYGLESEQVPMVEEFKKSL
jgi:glucose/mannose-6-phosphate isomerase